MPARSESGEPPIDLTTGASTLIDTLSAARDAGYTSDFSPLEDGAIRCSACRSSFRGRELGVEHEQRLEGASDVADMLIVVLGVCPRCGDGGALVLGYGPNASGIDTELIGELGPTCGHSPLTASSSDDSA